VTADRALSARAPAKINRELRVGPRRGDGYHDIRSRFVTIDLADSLEARAAADFSFFCQPDSLPADSSNLVARAARSLAEALGIAPHVQLRLSKRVPIGAGLGGGSADAAVTLRLLCRFWGAEPPEATLAEIAASLGSDVPFFLVGGEADVGGRGERVEPRDDRASEDLVLLVPPYSISTAEVYAAFDRLGGTVPLSGRLEIESSGRFFGPNDLERAIVAMRPEMGSLLERGRRIADECAVTGSGSTLVLRGAEKGGIDACLAANPGLRAMACRTVGRAEYRSLTGAREARSPA